MTDQEFINELTKPSESVLPFFLEYEERIRVLSKESQFKEWLKREMVDGSSHTDEYYLYSDDIMNQELGSRISCFTGLSDTKAIDIGGTFYTVAQWFLYEGEKYWVVTMCGQGAVSWLMTDEKFMEEYGELV
jgi:hypothetical protein